MGQSYQLPRDEEKRFIADSVETIHKVTGQSPIGWNAYWMRNSISILETLQDLGFLYHIDEPTREEARLDVRPDDLLVLYTDGLVERRDESLDDGLLRLADAAA